MSIKFTKEEIKAVEETSKKFEDLQIDKNLGS